MSAARKIARGKMAASYDWLMRQSPERSAKLLAREDLLYETRQAARENHVVHREGFGKTRIQRLHQRMVDTLKCVQEGYVSVAEIRENLAQEIGYDPISGKNVERERNA